ncbi:MAG: glycosyltransferase [Minisyncoccota bacterium]
MRFLYFGIYDPDFSRNRIYMRALREAGHSVEECRDSQRGIGKYFRLAGKLIRLRGTYDVLVVGYPGHIVVPLARLFSRGPVIADLLGSLSDASTQSHGAGFFRRIYLSCIDWCAIASADSVLVESEAQKEYLSRRFGFAHTYTVVYSGTDESVFGPRKEDAKREQRPFVALFRGRLTPESGIMHILDAAERLREHDDITFRIVGYGRLLEEVRRTIAEKRLGNVKLISEHLTFEAMREHMQDASVSLGQFEDNVRLQRTIPHKMFESISMGIPYITGRAPAAEELLEDGISALLVPLSDSAAIADAILRTKNDPSLGAHLASHARRIFEGNASQSVVSRLLAEIASRLPKKMMSLAFELAIVALLLAAFVAIRAPGLDLPYHQDEWKNAEMVRSGISGSLSAHPPLMEAIYRWSGDMFGAGNLRMMPLVFGVMSAFLLYLVVKRRANITAAIIATALYTVSAYSVLASLMLDMDGTILPTFFLAALYAYDRFRDAGSPKRALSWLAATTALVLIGFLTKLSFILVAGALALDYLVREWHRLTARVAMYAALAFLASAALLAALLTIAHYVLPAFDVQATIMHALWYVRFEGRGYMQILIQAVKALFYLAPALILLPLFLRRESLRQSSVFLMFLGLGFIFYFILFDFSQGALDKYLMYLIVPLCAMAGVVLAPLLTSASRKDWWIGTLLGSIGASVLIAVNFIPHDVMSLYPKTAWLSAVARGDWNILMPFTGGNGPLGFYVSFLMIAGGFIMSGALALTAMISARFRRSTLIALIAVSIAFNAIFIEELIWGGINGSAPAALRASIAYIQEHNIRDVITHADAGAYELNMLGAYAGRFYAVPLYEEGHRALFAQHTGRYLVVDMPRLNEDGFYRRYFATCAVDFETSSGVIHAYVYDCSGSNPYAIK